MPLGVSDIRRGQVYLMPLGGGVFNNPWDAGLSNFQRVEQGSEREKRHDGCWVSLCFKYRGSTWYLPNQLEHVGSH